MVLEYFCTEQIKLFNSLITKTACAKILRQKKSKTKMRGDRVLF